jgi:cob(I)alamin adenosyltransferase
MANRLTRITTRTGDNGSTGLADGSRTRKDGPRIEAMGSVDELNCALGVVASQIQAEETLRLLRQIQNRLFDLGGELALPGSVAIEDAAIAELENEVETLNAELPPLREFVLPGGNPASAFCHQARAVCRRAERDLIRLSQVESVNSASWRYLNRLSDLLFVLARVLARTDGGQEITWQREE